MQHFSRVRAALIAVAFLLPASVPAARACCPVSRVPVVNADQSVIILWSPATQTEHFIRQASFESDDRNLGFIIPSPTQPQLSESGDEAFGALAAITAPEFRQNSSMNFSCAASSGQLYEKSSVRVLDEKRVAGFDAVILEADSSEALAGWLSQHGYELSPAIAEWAAPYIAARWKFTALKVAGASGEANATNAPIRDAANELAPATPPARRRAIHAAALHMTFQTDRPLFPYREPNPTEAARTLGVSDRLLRIYFISDGRYQGDLTREVRWTGQAVWADKLDERQRDNLLNLLKIDAANVPRHLFLSEFEDHWPYRTAPGDLWFSREPSQRKFHRPEVASLASPNSADIAPLGFCGFLLLRLGVRRTKLTWSVDAM